MFRRDFLSLLLAAFFFFLFPAKVVFATMEVSGVPSVVTTDQEMELTINLSGLTKNAVYYFKGSFYLVPTNYFGLTWSGTSWVPNSDSFSKQFAATADSQGDGSFKLKVKVDPNDSGYQGPGNYSLKVARYTQAGSLSWSEAFPITINQAADSSNPSSPSGNITLSEFMPDPAGGNEWAEVYTPESFEADIGGWKIDDIEGASSPYQIPPGTKISPGGFLVFSFSSKLNNSGDSIRLLNPNGGVVETYSYKEAVKGDSFAKDAQGSWQITTTPTPGGPNKITLPATSKATSVKSSAAKNTTKSQTNTATADTSPSGSEDGNYNLDSNLSEAGTVAGATSQKQTSSGLAILLIAAGASFLFAAAAWPAVEKRIWKKEQ